MKSLLLFYGNDGSYRQILACQIVVDEIRSWFTYHTITHYIEHCMYLFQNMTQALYYLFQHLTAILEFMYAGEVNVAQDQLPQFLKTAERLKEWFYIAPPRPRHDISLVIDALAMLI